MPVDISLVIPCYHEASHLRDSVATLRAAVEGMPQRFEFIFVDDASRDATPGILRELCRDRPDSRLVAHGRNRGRGAAVKTGFALARGRIAGFLDIDLEVSPDHLPALLAPLERREAEVVTGRRYYTSADLGGLHREILSRGYRVLRDVLLAPGIEDTETGCKFFDREKASAAVLSSLNDGWFWDTEVLCRSLRAGLRVREVPVRFRWRRDKKSTVRLFRDSAGYFRDLLAFRREIGGSLPVAAKPAVAVLADAAAP